MDSAIVFSWTSPWAGREAIAMESMTDSLTFWGKAAADGKCGEPQTYLSPSLGMMIVHGDRDVLFPMLQTEEFRRIFIKASLAVPDLKYEFFATGEAFQEMMALWGTVGAELGYM